MTIALSTDDLGPLHTHRSVHISSNASWDLLEEGGPTASRAELGVEIVQGCIAACAIVDALLGLVSVVLASTGTFGSTDRSHD